MDTMIRTRNFQLQKQYMIGGVSDWTNYVVCYHDLQPLTHNTLKVNIYFNKRICFSQY